MAQQPATTQQLADYLQSGYWKSVGQSAHKFSLPTSRELTVNLTGLDAAGQKLARLALDAWEAVANIKFVETSGSAKITFKDEGDAANTYSKISGSSVASAEVVIGAAWTAKYGDKVGGYGFQTYVHEIGHALGLGHAGAYNGGASYQTANFKSDSWQQTVMSYLDQDENPNIAALKAYLLTPMMADVVAIQNMYGAAKTGVTAGATTYGLGSDLGTYLDAAFAGKEGSLKANALTIFDASGKDTFNFSDDVKAQTINLEGGTFSTVYGRLDGLGIAPGTVIETVLAGSGDDTVLGNAKANKLMGNGGNDKLSGLAGNDTLGGGEGSDIFVFDKGRDTGLDFQDNVDTIQIDNALWGNTKKSVAQVLAMAKVVDGDVVFTFSTTNTLRIDGVSDLNALVDDLTII